jgi:4-oxalocrotonate tautomerase
MPYIIVKQLRGRSVDLKRELARRITDATVEIYGVEPRLVTVRFEETDPENLATAGALAVDNAGGGAG